MKVLRCRAFLRLLCGVCLFIMGTMLLRQESIRIVITECMGRFWVPMFQPMDPVGNGTMYVPGSGFSGFWYHHGFFQNAPGLLDEYNFYCYSSGCLSLLLAFLKVSADDAWRAGFDVQSLWKENRLPNHAVVPTFLNRTVLPILEDDSGTLDFLPQMNFLITTNNGVESHQAKNKEELVDLMIKTTWIPFVTGHGILYQNGSYFLDGGFSRHLHPKCEHALHAPSTWGALVHSLNPGLPRDLVQSFWNMGQMDAATSLPN